MPRRKVGNSSEIPARIIDMKTGKAVDTSIPVLCRNIRRFREQFGWEQKELANISVTAICDLADVHRSTFYQYYSDQADLLREIEQDFLDMIPTPSQLQKDQDQILAVTTRFFDFIKQNEKTFRNCVYDHTAAPVTVHTVAKCRN